MNNQQRSAMQMALRKAFNLGQKYWQQADSEYASHWKKADATKAKFEELVEETDAALREALAQPQCNPHPDAPHGFDRNASHSANRYVCECEGWEPEQAEQEPVGYVYMKDFLNVSTKDVAFTKHVEVGTDLYAAPVRTKDLTDDEIMDLVRDECVDMRWPSTPLFIARAVIAADRRKNRW